MYSGKVSDLACIVQFSKISKAFLTYLAALPGLFSNIINKIINIDKKMITPLALQRFTGII